MNTDGTNKGSREGSLKAQAREIDLTLTAIRKLLSRPVQTAFAQGGLTGAQQAVMRVLVDASEPMTVNAVRQSVGLAQSTVSGIVHRLVKRGMIARQDDPADGRATLLAPSREVRRFLQEKVPKLVRSPLAEALAQSTDAERHRILEALRSLHRLLQQDSSGQSD